MAKIGLDRRGVAEQIVWFPLAGVVADETIKVVEPLDRTGRPVVERAGWARLPLRDIVVRQGSQCAAMGGGPSRPVPQLADRSD